MTSLELLAYDRWATARWLEALVADGTDEEWAVMRHLLAVHEVFLVRVDGGHVAQPPTIVDPVAAFPALADRWEAAASSHRHNPVVHYQRFDGEPQDLEFDLMVSHVVNHGTYHRGELRGMRHARGNTDFPETDLLIYLRTV